MAVERLTILRPDDWHVHLRDGPALADLVGHTARVFARAVVMPNLRPPILTTDQAVSYRHRILGEVPQGSSFEPLMTLYLTDETGADEIARAAASGVVVAAKLYPAGATTHSEAGVTDIDRIGGVLEALERHGMPLLVHAEVTDPEVDIFDRERVFVDRVLAPLVARFQSLKVVLEHVSTADGVQFVAGSTSLVAATVTPQHLMLNRNALFSGGLDPHHYCLPVVKGERHRQAVAAAATSDDPRFFLGTDSAPHPRSDKERRGGAAGIFSAHAALELYAELFDRMGALERLEAFASLRGAAFYGLEPSSQTITLVRDPWQVPTSYRLGDGEVVPLKAGGTVVWRVLDSGPSA